MITSNLVREQLWNWAELASSDWFRRQCAEPYLAMYLYYKPSVDGQHGALVIGVEPLSEDWQLAMNERVSPAWTKEIAASKCFEAALLLPIL